MISRCLCQKAGRELFRDKDRLGMCLCMDRALVKNAQLENKMCMWLQSSPTPSWGLTDSQTCSAETVLTSADVGIGIQLMPIKPEISRQSLQRSKYAKDQSDTICCDKAGYFSLSLVPVMQKYVHALNCTHRLMPWLQWALHMLS